MIRETAADICYTVEQRGQKNETQLNIDVQVIVISGLAKILGLGAQGSGKFTTQDYQGVTQEALATVIKSSTECRLTVSKSLVEKMPLITPPPGPTTFLCTDDYNGARSTIAINREGTELIVDMPGFLGGTEVHHYINGINRSICDSCGAVGAVIGEKKICKTLVEVKTDKITFGQLPEVIFTLNRHTGRLTSNAPLSTSSICQSTSRAVQ